MNLFNVLKLSTAGESHGPGIIAVISGFPSGLEMPEDFADGLLAARRNAPGRSIRMTKETDRCRVLSGVRKAKTIGSPITLLVENSLRDAWDKPPSRQPRPGHADWPGVLKRGFDDLRDVWERASARTTVALVCAGAVAERFLKRLDIKVVAWTEAIGGVRAHVPDDVEEIFQAIESSDIRCPDPAAEKDMLAEIERARSDRTTLGGVFAVAGLGVPAGLGDYDEFTNRLDAVIAGGLMSIPSVKAVEIGQAIEQSHMSGQNALDGFLVEKDKVLRSSNLSGGIEGGLSNGQAIVARCYVKPVPTQAKPLPSFDIKTLKQAHAMSARSDICVVPAGSVVAQAVLALVLADAILSKFGRDSMSEIEQRLKRYRDSLPT